MPPLRRPAAFALPLALVCCLALPARGDDASEVDVPTVDVVDGVVFSAPDGVELRLAYAVPSRGKGPFPVVLCTHGGGWRAGSRDAYSSLVRTLARRGFAAVTTSYRFTERSAWPAQLRDVLAARAWIVDNSSRLGFDPHRIGVLGASAGGHLSLMLGLLPDRGLGEPRLVEAVVNYFGPTEMTRGDAFAPEVDPLVVALAGGPRSAERAAIYRSLSPVTHVTPGDAPVLTFHGSADRIVPVAQARILHEALDGAGILNRLDVLDGRDHGWGGKDREATRDASIAFLHAYLRGSEHDLVAAEDFDAGADLWEMTDSAQWRAVRDGARTYLAMVTEKNEYTPKVRSPTSIALLRDVEVADFTFDVSLQYTFRDYGHASLCLFFGYQDPEHFYYVHFGKKADAHANSIFIVDGKPRVSIAATRTDGTDWDREWHRARIRRDVESGSIEVFFDDMEKPVMTAVDRTFQWGRVGVGSFDDKGNFDTIRLRGNLR